MAKPAARVPPKQGNSAPAPAAAQSTQMQVQQWAGPLPPPGALAQFNDIIPNGAERIMAMIEQEQAHRISHDGTVLATMAKDTKRGHYMGWTISIGAIIASVGAVALGAHPSVSVALVSLPILGIVRAILASKSKK